MEKTIYVFADWSLPDGTDSEEPQLVGTLTSNVIRNKELFSFSYAPEWLSSPFALPIDPDLQLYEERQFSDESNFRVFLDSCPDRWGRLLMKRREAALARIDGRRAKLLTETDYLLGVHDEYRMGGLRFKQELDGVFLDNNNKLAAPPMSSLR
ncbi:HipA N-terminal domain-containing protein [Leucothrix arctica]|uniref:HipA N-terminal domain-containing protein n=1 Tax=Leucothrix arctica TaxID=1481894 RepID=UPI001FE93F39|nr:HipA N-terminal domain-containing protein [Leucothrix arctica]